MSTSSLASFSPASLAPNDKEAKLIVEFRQRCADILKTKEHESDYYLIRWIRARENDLDKAEEMLRNNFKWREENGLDLIINVKLDKFYHENFPLYFEGHDKLGIPVIEASLGLWDIRKAMDNKQGGEEGFFKYTNQIFERTMQAIRDSNKGKAPEEYPNTLFSAIVDWKGYSYAQLCHLKALQNMLSMASRYEAYYPEIVHKLYFINCPKIFSMVFTLFKGLLAPKTVGKIKIYGSEKEYKEALLKDFELDQLGTEFGGSATRELKIDI